MKNRSKILMVILPVFACFAFLPGTQATCLDGCDNTFFNAFQGDDALSSNTTGNGNSAFGWRSLNANTDGSFNTAVGGGALILNIDGGSNTAVGATALLLNTLGSSNTAVGTDTLVNNIGGPNTAMGAFALFDNTIGFDNVGVGFDALAGLTTGFFNTAIGDFAGSGLIGGETLNIYIGAFETGFPGEINSIHIGDNLGTHSIGSINIGNGLSTPFGFSQCIIGGIWEQFTFDFASSLFVQIDSNGAVGTFASTRRVKHDIKPMDKASEAILALKPVTFHYNQDKKNTPFFGLIAEDVAEVSPDLVALDKEGKPWTVRYDQINAMLLNEFLKEHKRVEQQQASIAELKSTVAQQQKGMEVLTAQLKEQAAQIQKVSAQLEVSKPAPQVVVNKP